jgi:hypothetical protein
MLELFGAVTTWPGSVRGMFAFVPVVTAFPTGKFGEPTTVVELQPGLPALVLLAAPVADGFAAVPGDPPCVTDVPGLADDPACGAAGPVGLVGLVLVGPPTPEAAPPLEAPAAPPALPPAPPLCAKATLTLPASSTPAIVAIECRVRGIAVSARARPA